MIEPINYRQNWRKTKYKNVWVSDNGEVWNSNKGRIVKSKVKGTSPQINVENTSITIAKLVYQTFKGDVPKGYIVVHKDHILENNFIGNLVLMKRSEYQKINNRVNTGRKVEIRNKDGEVVKRYPTIKEFCRKNYISKSTVTQALNGEIKRSSVIPRNAHFLPRGYKETFEGV